MSGPTVRGLGLKEGDEFLSNIDLINDFLMNDDFVN